MKIDAVIATKNRPDLLVSCVRSVLKQSIEVSKIIIVDQSVSSSFEHLKSCFKSEEAVKLVYIHDQSVTGLTNARNVGVENSNADYCIFLDDDLTIDSEFILNSRKYLEAGIDGVSGVQTQDDRHSLISVMMFDLFHRGCFADIRRRLNYTARNNLGGESFVRSRTLSGGLTIYSMKVLKAQKFDENLVKYCLGEDKIFSKQINKLGFKTGICFSSTAIHIRSEIDRYDLNERIHSKCCFYRYFFENYTDKSLGNYCAFYWLKSGIFFETLFSAIKTGKMKPLNSFFLGSRSFKNSFEDCLFLDIK